MDLAGLKRWTPVGLTVGRPVSTIDWCDLTGIRFEEPFFDQTAARWTGAEPARRLVRTELDALLALDGEPSLEPSGIICHMSRCGSTVVSRLLAKVPGTIVVSEAAPLNALLEADPAEVDEAVLVQVLRLVVRALGRIRFGDECQYVLKMSSWNVRRIAVLRRAFPEVPLAFVYRAPVEVMASILAGPPGWMQLQRFPHRAEALLGIDRDKAPALSREEFCALALASFCRAALDHDDGSMLLIDYGELPEAAWSRVAPALGLAPTDADIRAMREEARFYAKDPVRRPFSPDGAPKRQVADAVRRLAALHLDPLYNALERRRNSRPAIADM